MNASAARSTPIATPPHRLLAMSEGRAVFELAAFYAARPLLALLPPGDGHPVLVLPGFMASDESTMLMRGLLIDLGYDARGWELGTNLRIDDALIKGLVDRLRSIHRETRRKVSLVGWSLGGLLARELAKIDPEAVRLVISLGSPISDDRNHSNARGLYEMINGTDAAPVHNGHRFTGLNSAPPVPTTSILTKSDGIVHWRGSVQHPENGHGETENIEVMASHLGLGVNPSVMVAIADRLAQPEGEWAPFQPNAFQQWMFPNSELF